MDLSEVVDALKKEAGKSLMRSSHAAAVLNKDGDILSIDHNKHLSMGSIHAEQAAWRKWERSKRPRGWKAEYMVVIRVNKNGKLMNSKPCARCRHFLDGLGITVLHS